MLKGEKRKKPHTKFTFEGFGEHQESQPLDQFWFCALMKNLSEALFWLPSSTSFFCHSQHTLQQLQVTLKLYKIGHDS